MLIGKQKFTNIPKANGLYLKFKVAEESIVLCDGIVIGVKLKLVPGKDFLEYCNCKYEEE